MLEMRLQSLVIVATVLQEATSFIKSPWFLLSLKHFIQNISFWPKDLDPWITGSLLACRLSVYSTVSYFTCPRYVSPSQWHHNLFQGRTPVLVSQTLNVGKNFGHHLALPSWFKCNPTINFLGLSKSPSLLGSSFPPCSARKNHLMLLPTLKDNRKPHVLNSVSLGILVQCLREWLWSLGSHAISATYWWYDLGQVI